MRADDDDANVKETSLGPHPYAGTWVTADGDVVDALHHHGGMRLRRER
ncbi:hypothetical protein [Azospirillum sp. ST 5-10]